MKQASLKRISEEVALAAEVLIVDQFEVKLKQNSEDSVNSIASSASDEEINMLEKQLDIDLNNELPKFPSESLNTISRILIFSNPGIYQRKGNVSKVANEIVLDHAFPFNTELLTTDRQDLVPNFLNLFIVKVT